ncbi:MAG TPA: hypothetical protein VIF62_27425, partial [Labilithrix sp.]
RPVVLARTLRLRSPREHGIFSFETIAMPADMGVFDVERLRRFVAQRATPPPFDMFQKRRFDEIAWADGVIACVGWSCVDNEGARLRGMLERSGREIGESTRARLAEAAQRPPTIERTWYLACGTEMANVWFRTTDGDTAAADIADCEDMVRSLRFARRDQ